MKIKQFFGSLAFLIALLLPMCNCLQAQTALALSSATVTLGGAAALNLTLSSTASSQTAGGMVAAQWTFSYPASSVGAITVAAGPVLSAASKTVSCAGGTNSY